MTHRNRDYRPTLAQLRTFVTIAEQRHFGTAAAKLGISQPSLSQGLVALENGLGIDLIERSTRKVIVTPVGRELLPYARKTLEDAETFLSHAQGIHGEFTGPLAIGIIPTIAPYLLPELLPRIKEAYPRLEPRFVEERTEPLINMLREGLIDVAIMALPSEAAGMRERTFYSEQFVVVVDEDNPLAGKRDLDLSALRELDLLLLDDGHCLHNQILDLCHTADVDTSEATNAATRASSMSTLIQLVAAGMGSTLVPLSAVRAECMRDGLATATFAESVHAHRNVGLVYRASSTRAAEFDQLGLTVTEAYQAVAENNPLDMPARIWDLARN